MRPATIEDKTKKLCIATVISVITYAIVAYLTWYVLHIERHTIATFPQIVQIIIRNAVFALIALGWPVANLILSVFSLVYTIRYRMTMVAPATLSLVFAIFSPLVFWLYQYLQF